MPYALVTGGNSAQVTIVEVGSSGEFKRFNDVLKKDIDTTAKLQGLAMALKLPSVTVLNKMQTDLGYEVITMSGKGPIHWTLSTTKTA